jgi:hypothetical protein
VGELPSDLIIRPYIVSVSGFGELTWFARSRGKALATAWEAYCSYRDDVDFKAFLKLARCVGERACGSRFGEPIMVGSERAYYVSHDRQYIQFVRPNSDVVLHSHPLDVEPPEARRGTPYAALTDTKADREDM